MLRETAGDPAEQGEQPEEQPASAGGSAPGASARRRPAARAAAGRRRGRAGGAAPRAPGPPAGGEGVEELEHGATGVLDAVAGGPHGLGRLVGRGDHGVDGEGDHEPDQALLDHCVLPPSLTRSPGLPTRRADAGREARRASPARRADAGPPTVAAVEEGRKGTLLGAGAYACWGLFPLYWPLLEPGRRAGDPGPPDRLVAGRRRRCWSGPAPVPRGCARCSRDRAAPAAAGRGRGADRGQLGRLHLGRQQRPRGRDRLGYFINPLFTVLLGVVVLGERLRRAAVGRASAIGARRRRRARRRLRPPAVDRAGARGQFGTYGLLKKSAGVGAVEGLAVETRCSRRSPRSTWSGSACGATALRRRTAPGTRCCWPAPASSPWCRC